MYLPDIQTYNKFIFEVDEDTNIKSLLLDQMHFSVRQSILIKKGDIKMTVDGKNRPKDCRIKKKSIIEIDLPYETSDYKIQQSDKIKILYEDDDIMAVEKPAFMVSHPTRTYLEGTLLNFVQGIFEQKNIHSKVRLISRLDRDTSGIVTIAKNSFAHSNLSQGDFSQSLKKYYTAIVKGRLEKKEGIIDRNIKKSEDSIRREVSAEGQRAVTRYKVIEEKNGYTVVRLLLETGRTHQIRVHLSSMNCPIVGDCLYGYDDRDNIIDRQALHCSRVELVSPRSGKKIEIVSELPEDMKKIING